MTNPTLTVQAAEHERAVGIDELFFSTTDRRGVITGGNEVFIRISGYDIVELTGHHTT